MRSRGTRQRFRRWLKLLPFDIQREYGGEMEEIFLMEHADRATGRPRGRRRLWLETIGGLLAFARREQWAETRRDLREAVRRWRRSPALFAVLLSTMCVGLTGLAVAFAVVDAVLLRPLGVTNPNTLVRTRERHPGAPQVGMMTYATFLDLEGRMRSYRHVAAARWTFVTFTGDGGPERFTGAQVSGEFFEALGTPPLAGRLLVPADDRPGQSAVVVLSEGLWRRRFGADRSLVGRRLHLNGRDVEVVGVLPDEAAWPLGTQVWTPLLARSGTLAANRRSHLLQVIARLAPGASFATARAELNAVAASIEQQHPGADPDLGLDAEPVLDRIVAPVQTALWAVLAAAVLLLVVLGVNVAQVQIARAAAREPEFSLRIALGASRRRLARQLLTESVALSIAAAGPALALTYLAVSSLPAVIPADVPRAHTIAFDWRVAAVTVAVAAGLGLLCGLWPALRSRLYESRSLSLSGRRITAIAGGRWLAAAQLAVTCALFVAAALIVRSAIRSAQVPLGFEPADAIRVDVSLTGRIPSSADGRAYAAVLEPIVDQLGRIPGVSAVGLTNTAPFSGGAATNFVINGVPVQAGHQTLADIRIVDTGFFRALQVPLRAGRTFRSADTVGATPVVIVSDTLARHHFPDVPAVGQSITMLDWGPPISAEVVGVVGDVVGQDLESESRPTIYWHYPQFPQLFTISLFVRTSADPAGQVDAVKRAIWAVEPNLPLPRIEPMSRSADATRARRNVLTDLLLGLAVSAAVFCIVGLYGVLLHQAGRDRIAHGVRLAFGAGAADLAWLVLRDAARTAAIGLGAGLILSYLTARSIASLLYQIRPTDGLSYLAAIVACVIVILLAALIPAWRTSRLDPSIALHAE
jgi:predicted permease